MIFSKGGATPVSPSVKPTHRRRASSSLNVVETFRAVEDDVDAATPVDAQNAPTGVWKSRTEREIPTASTSITLLDKEENEEQRQLIPTVYEIGSAPVCLITQFTPSIQFMTHSR